MLYGRESRLAGEVVIRHLLLQKVRRVIRSDGVNQAIAQGLTQGFLVAMRLDGWIALDGKALRLIVTVVEPEVMRTSLCRDTLLLQRDIVPEQSQFRFGGDMQHVQTGTELLGHIHRLRGRPVTGLHRADKGMDARIQFNLSFSCQVLAAHRILMDGLFILTMRGNQARRLTEEAHQHLILVHQHITRAAAHEELDAAHPFRVGLLHLFEVVVGSPEVERVVGQRLLSRHVKLLLQKVLRRGLRHRVGHIHERGHTPSNGSTAFGVNVGLVRHSWLTEMHMLVNDTWNQVSAFRLNDLG